MKNIFVGNLSYQVSESELRSAFEQFGQVLNVNTVTDRETGRARGFAFIEMASDEEADRAISGMSGKPLGGRNLTVNEARPRGEKGSPRGGGRSRNDRDPFRRRY